MVVDTDEENEGGFGIEAVKVPVFRGIHLFEGTPEEICRQIEGLPKRSALVPYVFTDVALESPDEVFEARARIAGLIESHFEEGHRPRIVEPREHVRRVVTEEGEQEVVRALSLDDLTPEEVFVRMYTEKHKGHAPSADYLTAFRYLMSSYLKEEDAPEEAPILRGEVAEEAPEEGVEARVRGEETV
jgi:hypothetical protein